MLLEAYAPLTRGLKLSNRILHTIAQKHKKTSAQIVLRWALQLGVAVIPKSRRPERIRENADIFDFNLSQDDMTTLSGLNEGFRTC